MSDELVGAKALMDKLNHIASDLPEVRDKFLTQEAELLKGRVKEKTPVGDPAIDAGSGQLRNGWHQSEVADGKVDVYNNTDYAAHVEFGHRTRGGNSFVTGQKMLQHGFREQQEHFNDDAGKLVEGLINK
jgi:hypothetical protein